LAAAHFKLGLASPEGASPYTGKVPSSMKRSAPSDLAKEMTPPYPTEFERRIRRAYSTQRRSAIKRGIPFLFTFEQWRDWWLTDDRWSNRGRKAGQLQMGRKGDRGPAHLR
jgi:hypothetical protein